MVNKIGKNISKPIIRIAHSELILYSSASSDFKTICPSCSEGLLLVHRDNKTLILEGKDRCTLCGQEFEYTDIEEMRKKDGWKPSSK